MRITKDIVGKVIVSVTLTPEKEFITFKFTDGSSRKFGVEGDCCSHSWIEHLEMPNDVAGATILDVTDSGIVHPDTENQAFLKEHKHDCLQVYNTVFKTDRGEIILEYRNDSNGYYGGYLYDAGN